MEWRYHRRLSPNQRPTHPEDTFPFKRWTTVVPRTACSPYTPAFVNSLVTIQSNSPDSYPTDRIILRPMGSTVQRQLPASTFVISEH